MTNIIILVRNGSVTEVVSNQRETYVTVIDLDKIAMGDAEVELNGSIIKYTTSIAELDKILEKSAPYAVW